MKTHNQIKYIRSLPFRQKLPYDTFNGSLQVLFFLLTATATEAAGGKRTRIATDAGRKGTAAATDTVGKRTRIKGTATVSSDSSTVGLAHRFAHSRRGSEVLVQGLVSKRGFFNDFSRKKMFIKLNYHHLTSSSHQIKIDYRENIEFSSYVIS